MVNCKKKYDISLELSLILRVNVGFRYVIIYMCVVIFYVEKRDGVLV